MLSTKLKIATALLLTVSFVAGAGALAHQVLEAKPSEIKQDTGPQPAAKRPESKTQEQARTDRYGDPLPPDAVTRLGTTRFWSTAGGTQVAFTPDGGKVLAANWGGVFIFDTTTGKQLRHIRTSPAQRTVNPRTVNSTSLSPDGEHLALGTDSSADSGIQIWDLASGQLLRECQDTGHQQYLGVLFSPDGKMLASYSFPSKTIYLWDPATGREIRRWFLSSQFGGCFAFSPDSKMLIVGDLRTIHFWDTTTGKEVRRIVDHPGACVYRLVLAQDGKVLATHGLTEEPKVGKGFHRDNRVHLWDTTTGKKVRQIEVVADSGTKQAMRNPDFSEIAHFQFSPDTKFLATASGDGVLRVWDVATGKELRRWDTSGWLSAFAFSPDGRKLASIGGGNTVRLWDAATGKELREHPSHRDGFHVLALSPDGRTLASAGGEREVRLWDAVTGRLQGRLTAVDRTVHALHISADGRTLTMVEGTVDAPHFSADRSTFITHGSDGKARVWDIATGKELRQFPAPVEGRGRQQVISPDGKSWASDSVDTRNGTANPFIWDAATGKKLQAFVVNTERGIWALGFSPDSGTLYSWGGDKRVRLWDVATGKRLREFTAGAEQGVYMGSFSPDGNWLACGSRDKRSLENELLLYDMATGTAVRRIEIPAISYGNRSFAISPDSRTLALGDGEGTIHLLELASGKFRRRLVGGHQGGITALLFSTDGKRLVSGSTDTTALVWDLTGRLHARRKPLRAADLDACWTDLAGEDAERAYQSIRRLAASPTETVLYLGKHLQPTASVDTKRVDRLIVDLDSDQFAVRTQASEELEKLGEAATAACRKALVSRPSSELRRRLEMLLEKHEQERRSPSPPRLRILRALEALELAGTPESRQLLRKLADGASEACMTREARAALERLAKRSATAP